MSVEPLSDEELDRWRANYSGISMEPSYLRRFIARIDAEVAKRREAERERDHLIAVLDGIPSDAWSTVRILEAVRSVIDETDLGLDDGLWCYAYEPRCQEARRLVYTATGSSNKHALIAWDASHSPAERVAVIDHLLALDREGEADA